MSVVRLAAFLVTIIAAASSLAQQISVKKDILYLPNGTKDQSLDLYLPESSGFPVVLFVHGGSLQETAEHRSSPVYQNVCPRLAAAGVGCATIDYRLAPTHQWPAMPNDVAAAVKWVKGHVAALGGDPNRIVLFGHSSGCHLAAIVGANSKFLAGVGLHPSDIAGIVAMGCTLAPLDEVTKRFSMDELHQRWLKSDEVSRYGTLENRLDSDPSRFVGPEMPPLLVIVAAAERFMPPILEQGSKVVRRLLEIHRPANLVIVPGEHMTSIDRFGTPGDATFAAVKAFIDDPNGVALKD